MRNAALATAAILTFGCAQGVPGEPPVDAEATTPQQPDAGPGDGGVAAGPCDPSIAASEGVAIVDTGACPGVIPAASTCAAEITICSGLGSGDTGNAVVGATSDGRGSVVLSCRRNDVGPPQLNFLFVAIRNGFVSKASLGVDVRPLRDGFIASEGSYLPPPPTYDFLAHDGGFRAAQSGGALYAGPDSAVIVRAGDGQLIAQSFAADGTSRMTTAIGAFTGSAGSLMLSGATSSTGATLVVWQVQGEANATARWLAADGSASSAPFSIAGWSSSAPQTAALAGGAIAIAAEPPGGGGRPDQAQGGPSPRRPWRPALGGRWGWGHRASSARREAHRADRRRPDRIARRAAAVAPPAAPREAGGSVRRTGATRRCGKWRRRRARRSRRGWRALRPARSPQERARRCPRRDRAPPGRPRAVRAHRRDSAERGPLSAACSFPARRGAAARAPRRRRSSILAFVQRRDGGDQPRRRALGGGLAEQIQGFEAAGSFQPALHVSRQGAQP